MEYHLKVTDKAGKLHQIEAYEGVSVMEILRDAGLVEGVCGGVCACATCHVGLGTDWFAKAGTRGDEEEMLLEELPEMQDGSRLGCQIPFTSELNAMELVLLDD